MRKTDTEEETLRKMDLFLGKVSKEKDESMWCRAVSQGDRRARRDNSAERQCYSTTKQRQDRNIG